MITYKQYNFCRKIGLPPIPHVERYFNSVNFGLLDIFKRKPKNQPEENTKETEEDLSKLREESTKKGYAKSKDGNFVYIDGAPFSLNNDHTKYNYIVNGIYIFFNANCNLKKIAKVYSQQNQMRFLNSFEGTGGQAWAAALANYLRSNLQQTDFSLQDAMDLICNPDRNIYLEITENSLNIAIHYSELDKMFKVDSKEKYRICILFTMLIPQYRISVELLFLDSKKWKFFEQFKNISMD